MRKLAGGKLMKMRTRKKMMVRDQEEMKTVLITSKKNVRKSLQSRRTSKAE
jgi:hypothetical protein